MRRTSEIPYGVEIFLDRKNLIYFSKISKITYLLISEILPRKIFKMIPWIISEITSQKILEISCPKISIITFRNIYEMISP